VVIDTLRWDHLGCYGYPRPTTPAIDRLAAGAVRYRRAYSQAPFTNASIGSLFTSRYPSQLGINGTLDTLPESELLASEVLRAAGFRTAAVVSHRLVSRRWGFAQGFQTFDESSIGGHEASTGVATADRALELLDRLAAAGEPFFLWVHFFDPHYNYIEQTDARPYEPPPYRGDLHSGTDFREVLNRAREGNLDEADLDYLRYLYDTEILHTDRQVGRILDRLELLGLAGRTVVALTADHGEEFLDHGALGHGDKVWDEAIRVPLVVRAPGLPPRVVEEPVGLLDLFPTLLAHLGLVVPAGFEGRALDLAAGTGLPDRPLFAASWGSSKRSVVLGRLKLIHDARSERLMLFNLIADPAEERDVSTRRRRATRRLQNALREWDERTARSAEGLPPLEVDEEEARELRTLGYL
jgi:arylsulfatase A-like enzyme